MVSGADAPSARIIIYLREKKRKNINFAFFLTKTSYFLLIEINLLSLQKNYGE